MTPQPDKEPMTAEKLAEFILCMNLENLVDGKTPYERVLDAINQHTEELQAEVERLKGIIQYAHTEIHAYLNNYSTMEEINESHWAVSVYTRLGSGLGNIGASASSELDALRQENERLAMELSVAQRDVLALREALNWLVELKKEKEKQGLSHAYVTDKPLAWQAARETITSTQASYEAARGRIIDEILKHCQTCKGTGFYAPTPGSRHICLDCDWVKALKTNGGK